MSKLMPNLDRQSAKVLNLTVLQRIDPYVEEILMTAAHVTFYEFNVDLNQWKHPASVPIHCDESTSTDNLVEDLLGDFEFEVQVPYLLYRNSAQEVNGIWFYNSRDCEAVASLFGRILNAFSKVPPKSKVPVNKGNEFEELEATPSLSVMDGPLEPPTKSSAAVTDVPEDSFVNFFSAAMNIGNANTAITGPQHQPSSPTPSVSVHPAPNIQPVPSFPFSSAPIVPALESNESISSNNLASNLVKPSLFSHSPPSSALLMPPIASSVPAAPPLHPPVTMQRPYGTPLLQPFPPPAPPPSLTPTQNSAPVITRDKVRDALLRLVQFKLLEESSYGLPSGGSCERCSCRLQSGRGRSGDGQATVRCAEADDGCRRLLWGRVTLGDVASRAGLKLNEAERALQALAADTNGFLEVSDEGDVLYVFSKDYRSKLAAKSFRMKVEPFLEKLKGASEYVIRVSFGTTLVLSIVLVYTTIIALISSRSEEDNRGRRGGRSYDSGITVVFNPFDLFWYWDPYYYRRQRTRNDDGMNFVESVFSFVFGDGDPNQGLEDERWKLIGRYISSNGGVVTAEELSPYLDVEPMEKAADDDSYILPVLLRFDGHPEVDDEGNILYCFPSLQRTALSQRTSRKEYVGKKWAEWVNGVEKFFEEKKWSFSKTSTSEKAMVIGLGALNLFGVIVLGSMLKNSTIAPSSFVSFVADIFPLLQVYAASFFAVPLIRWFLVQNTNAVIERRNLARRQRAKVLELPDPTLRRKLLNARDMAKRTVIGSERIVYSTEKDLLDQDYEAREWDKRFRELDRSD
ncbi:hypothetical protein HPP92_005162 [Vanilla planifolia]|uniref:Uncharacterized protein n=1 Tax=Vanilla planifolia TaxID=51239 RepID=A0A835VED1_VANPL|nr:hypothetical protein HPP92_005162 [Vanilla planifolia]